ncbi:Alpha/Beta hydrolase protein [Podospora aff. communis PSN243]|uniref:Alpha/Beta hydrolase protein n=1 Tax=Podospora aff. communis PSN243 TaxID=3040156 RepID=A0AAV9GD91_9PEZI|nr:Alpha/Beta hydrolase protein [Podospora aff. communis PSN243]
MTSTHSNPSLAHHFATAEDGAQLSYYSIGTGPGIVIVHGAMSYALTHKDLAVALSPYFTVNIFSRRTRGLSDPFPPSITNPPALPTPQTTPSSQTTMRIANRAAPRTYPPSYSSAILQTEVSDLHTILKTTTSHFVISISSGALITLSYLLTYSCSPERLITKAILFEPAVQFFDLPGDKPSSLPAGAGRGIALYEERRAAGDMVEALVAALKATGMVPGWVPGWVLRGVMKLRARKGDRDKEGEEDVGVTDLLKLAEALRYDFCVGEAMVGDSERCKGLKGVEVLLMGGTESRGYLGEGMDVLGGLIEGSKRVVVQGLGHGGLGQGGKPERAVGAIRRFFEGL